MSRKSYIAKTPLYTSTVKYLSIRTMVITSMSRIPACWGLSGFFSWRWVNSLGSHFLFLGLNYPINQEITIGKDLYGREALFAMENCVYTHYKKRHIRDILGRTNFFSIIHMTIIVTKPGIIIDVVGPYFYEKNHDRKWAFHPGRAGDAAA